MDSLPQLLVHLKWPVWHIILPQLKSIQKTTKDKNYYNLQQICFKILKNRSKNKLSMKKMKKQKTIHKHLKNFSNLDNFIPIQ
jgi:uncharacterized membrane protein